MSVKISASRSSNLHRYCSISYVLDIQYRTGADSTNKPIDKQRDLSAKAGQTTPLVIIPSPSSARAFLGVLYETLNLGIRRSTHPRTLTSCGSALGANYRGGTTTLIPYTQRGPISLKKISLLYRPEPGSTVDVKEAKQAEMGSQAKSSAGGMKRKAGQDVADSPTAPKSSTSKGKSAERPIIVPSSASTTFYNSLQTSLAPLASLSNDLGDSSDLSLHRSMDRKFGKELDKSGERVVGLVERLMRAVQGEEGGKGRKMDEEDLVGDFEGSVRGVVDGLLEKTDMNLDIVTGKRKAFAIKVRDEPVTNRGRLARNGTSSVEPLPENILNANIPKPQLLFSIKPDNSSASPAYKPDLTTKAHAIVPLDYIPTPSRAGTPATDGGASGDEKDKGRQLEANREKGYKKHPYYYETKHISYPSSLFTIQPPIEPQSFASTPFTFIDTPEAYHALVKKLTAPSVKELAIDLEHHSYRSYLGFLCLMQISTREEDFVIDLIQLRDLVREDKLGGVLVDPSVVKVFHGAESDIVWLQQDFDMFVVGLFDTYHAAKKLEYPHFSLAFLLKHHCSFEADKRYQLADWRIRPLPEDMLHYARSDTHFLLYVYDQLRNTLLERDDGGQSQIREVLTHSSYTAMKLYEKPVYNDRTGTGLGGWKTVLKLMKDHRGSMWRYDEYGAPGDRMTWGRGEQGYKEERVYRRLHAWRDAVAREQDESLQYVLPNFALWQISTQQPQDSFHFNALVNPKLVIVRSRADEIIKLVGDAQAEGTKNYADMLKDLAAQDAAANIGANVVPAVQEPLAIVAPSTAIEEVEEIAVEEAEDRDIMGDIPLPSIDLWIAAHSQPGASTDTAKSINPETRAFPKSRMFGHLLNKQPKAEDLIASASKRQAILASFTTQKVAQVLSETMTTQTADTTITMATTTTTTTATVPDDMPMTPETIPYIPPAQRTTKPVKDKDEVVTVKKAKKRKAAPEPEIEEAVASSSAQSEEAPQQVASPPKKKKKAKATEKPDIPEIDFSQEPNQLDTFAPESSTPNRIKKPKKAKQPIVDLSNFRKPPQDPTAVNAGNRSHTFK